ncbi:AMP-binding protein, partial [Abyssisolibacter fermentans]|uniref:AMP-binding protein n=1 Tax=Abyssisolibacter fermentans TaxID=1766203 RepID=UPI000AEC7C7D
MLKHKSKTSENLVECLQEISIKNSSKGITFIQNDEEDFLSYSELYDKALMTLNELQKKNIKPGDELVFQLDENKELLIIFWACLLGGIIPITTTVAANEASKTKLSKIWGKLNNPYLITSKKAYEKLKKNTFVSLKAVSNIDIESRIMLSDIINVNKKNGVIHEIHPDDIAYIQFSSGSTGDPKGVVLTHENVLTNLETIAKAFEVTNDDCVLGWMPLTHTFGLLVFHILPLTIGFNQIIMPTNTFIKTPLQWMDKAHEHKATSLACPNFAFKHFLSFLTDEEKEKKQWDLSRVRVIANAAEPISADLNNKFFNEMSRWGLKENIVVPCYGLTEATAIVTACKIGEKLKYLKLHRDYMSIGQQVMEVGKDEERGVTLVDVGHDFDSCKMKICDNEGSILPDNVVGEIYIKGKNVTSGYYNNSEATKSTITEDGWLKTGDLGFKRNGELFVSGRKKEIIFVNGQNYYPNDIEMIASEIKGGEAGKVVVCGIYNPQLEKDDIIMFILFEDDVEKFVSKAIEFKKYINLSTGLVLKHVLPINKIPKTISGKVQRYMLKEAYSKGEYKELGLHLDRLIKEKIESRDVDLPTTKLEMQLVNMWSNILGINNIGINDNFFELGGNSLKIASLIKKIHETLNISLTMGEIFNFATVKTLSIYITDIKTNNSCQTAATLQTEELEYYPLAAPQKRIYVLCKFNENNLSYNTPIAFKIKGNVNIKRLKAVLDKLVKRHEALRTGFVSINNIPYQKIYDEVKFNVEEINAKGKAVEEIIEEFVRPFDLNKPPIFRVGLVTLDVDDYILIVDMHHIIFDGQSARVLVDEI